MRDTVPYFPLYAENIIANRHYRSMSLIERGLYMSILLECWPNESVPSQPEKMAKVLGFNLEDIKTIPMENIMKFFKVRDNEIISPELEAKRKEFLETREKKAAGGRLGAERKKAKRKGNPEGNPVGLPEGSLGYVNSSQLKSDSIQSHHLHNENIDNGCDDPDSDVPF